MIQFIHITSTGNSGDLASGPYQWFDFGRHRVSDLSDRLPRRHVRAVIYGGGALTGWLCGATRPDADIYIAWGVGSTRHGEIDPDPVPGGFNLFGRREWIYDEVETDYVPCVSCMSPHLDIRCPIEHEAVLFVNASSPIKAQYPVAVTGLPKMNNTHAHADICRFFASAETVVTNSYHGVFWATLLNRRVVCLPYSSKFHHFRFPPAYSRNGGLDWRERASDAQTYPEALAECRQINRQFYARVRALIDGA